MWENQSVSAALAMDSSYNAVMKWRKARDKNQEKLQTNPHHYQGRVVKWKLPVEVNVDASFFPNSKTFKIGMVLRNHEGAFLARKNICLQTPSSVFEAKAIGVGEALTWIKD